MAITATAVWEVRSTATAANVNGGFFKPGATGVDYSQQDAAQYTLTGATTAAQNAIILHASAAADMVGNGLYISAGTNFTVGWYEITAVDPGVSITVDRNCCSAAASLGALKVGGAISLSSTNDAEWGAALVAGNTVYIKSGSYTHAESFSGMGTGTAAAPINLIGYATTRGDNPTGATRPTFNCQAFATTLGSYMNIRNVIMSGTASTVLILGNTSKAINCKIKNTSTTADRFAITASTHVSVIGCELISYRGVGLRCVANAVLVDGCYIHDCKTGVQSSASSGSNIVLINTIIAHCYAFGVELTAAGVIPQIIQNCTLVGHPTKMAVGIDMVTGHTGLRLINSIIYGWTTGVNHADSAQLASFDWYNVYYNNTTNATNHTISSTSLTATDTSFTGVTGITGTTATTSGAVLTQSGGNFSTVVDGQDYLYIVSGTGVTAGIYGITSHTATTLTLDINPGDSAVADKTYKILTSRNFTPGEALRGEGYPDSFLGAETSSAPDIGAVAPPAGGSGGGSGGGSLGNKRMG